MSGTQPVRRSQVWVWVLVCLLAIFLVLVVLVRIARGDSGESQDEPAAVYLAAVYPAAVYIVSPWAGTFAAGAYQGAEPYVSVGSQLETALV